MSIIDLHIAQKLKKRREELGIKRKSIAHHLQVSYQQIQKYETGQNRISASRLYLLSQLLNVQADYFFEGLPGIEIAQQEKGSYHEKLRLTQAYFDIPQTEIRESVISLLAIIGQTSHNDESI